METVDALIIVFAVIAVVGSAAGAFLYEAPPSPDTFIVTFSQDEDDVSAPDTSATTITSYTLTVPVDIANLTGLTIDVSVRPSGGVALRQSPLEATITLASPDGETVGTEALSWDSTDQAAKVASFPVASRYLAAVPPPPEGAENIETQNMTLEEARAWAAAEYTNETGRGDWLVTVQLSGGVGVGETITIGATGTAESYYAIVQLKTPDISGAAQ